MDRWVPEQAIQEWEDVEAAATRGQSIPKFEDLAHWLWEPHPAIISSKRGAYEQTASERPPCSWRRSRSAGPTEVVLDESDGLDGATLCKCDLIYSVEKTQLTNHRGKVTFERRREIARKVVQSLAFAGL
jgi:hypothetical protein